ncbi:hypothetical protein FPV67DRAFT_1451083 [Lyophyllum atratum]|nr:hypothetical protein FPV67DRAFT_1451083 [Lyophyllum atratum]
MWFLVKSIIVVAHKTVSSPGSTLDTSQQQRLIVLGDSDVAPSAAQLFHDRRASRQTSVVSAGLVKKILEVTADRHLTEKNYRYLVPTLWFLAFASAGGTRRGIFVNTDSRCRLQDSGWFSGVLPRRSPKRITAPSSHAPHKKDSVAYLEDNLSRYINVINPRLRLAYKRTLTRICQYHRASGVWSVISIVGLFACRLWAIGGMGEGGKRIRDISPRLSETRISYHAPE